MAPDIDYMTLSAGDVATRLEEIAREVDATFGSHTARQLNWRPDPTRWSVAQCLEHLVASNRMMLEQMEAALAPGAARSVWQRLPVLPAMFGRMLVTSQAPGKGMKAKTSPAATPTSSDIGPDVIARFGAQHAMLATRARALTAAQAHVVMTSPFAAFVCYPALDGWRLMVSHGWRHVEQARGVTQAPGFPAP